MSLSSFRIMVRGEIGITIGGRPGGKGGGGIIIGGKVTTVVVLTLLFMSKYPPPPTTLKGNGRAQSWWNWSTSMWDEARERLYWADIRLEQHHREWLRGERDEHGKIERFCVCGVPVQQPLWRCVDCSRKAILELYRRAARARPHHRGTR